jgi:hypothetical protein
MSTRFRLDAATRTAALLCLLATSLVIAAPAAALGGAQETPPAGAAPAESTDEVHKLEQKADAAVSQQPGLSKADALQREAVQETSTMLAGKTGSDRVAFAASVYFGFWSVNMRTRADYCAEQGVGISAFSSAFEQLQQDITVKARTLYPAAGIDETAAYAELEPQFRKLTDIDMQGLAKARGLSTMREACQYLQDHGAEIAHRMLFARSKPDVYDVLMKAP